MNNSIFNSANKFSGEENIIFKINENCWFPKPIINDNTQEKLINCVYEYKESIESRQFWLELITQEYDLPKDIWLEDTFVDNILTTRKNISDNLGIILAGNPGTGKTLLSKFISNKIDAPKIIIKGESYYLQELIKKLRQPVIFLFDEFEKTWNTTKNSLNDLCSILDGISTITTGHTYIFTSNKPINELPNTLFKRPSRIRYKKEFIDLSDNFIRFVIDKFLIEKDFKLNVIKKFSECSNKSIDVLKTIIEEINIHKNVETLKYLNI